MAPPVKPLGARTHHFWLAQRMAAATGADLVAATQQAALSQSDWADMVERCRGCAWGTQCARWLEHPQHAACDRAPSPCVNRKKFNDLKVVLQEVS